MTDISNTPTASPSFMPTNTTNSASPKDVGTEIGVGVLVGIAIAFVIGIAVICQKLICFKIFDSFGTSMGTLQDICSCYRKPYNEANNKEAKTIDTESKKDKSSNVEQNKKDGQSSDLKSSGVLPLDLSDQSIIAGVQQVGGAPLVLTRPATTVSLTESAGDITAQSIECVVLGGNNSAVLENIV